MGNTILIKNKDYYEGLDGIRAFAVIFVMLFHFYPQGVLTLGWTGVDLFFVLSGFLITNILIKNKDKDNYFKSFYMRRVIRIFPVYYLVVIPMLLINVILLHNRDWMNLGSYLIYFQNFTAVKSDYLFGLAHTWSLAIEEQFYLFFPFIIRIFSLKNSLRISVLLIIAAVILRSFFAWYYPQVTYFQSTLIFTRMDSLIIGAVLPLCISLFEVTLKILNKILNIAIFISGILIVISLLNYDLSNLSDLHLSRIFFNYGNYNLSTPYGHFKYTILAVFFAAIIGKLAYNTSSFANKFIALLSFKPLAYIGKISYGIYLYHWVIQEFFTLGLQKLNLQIPVLLLVGIKIGLSILIAAISWKLLEKPILKMKHKFNY